MFHIILKKDEANGSGFKGHLSIRDLTISLVLSSINRPLHKMQKYRMKNRRNDPL